MSRPVQEKALTQDQRNLLVTFDKYLESLIEGRMRHGGGSGHEMDLSGNILPLFKLSPAIKAAYRLLRELMIV